MPPSRGVLASIVTSRGCYGGKEPFSIWVDEPVVEDQLRILVASHGVHVARKGFGFESQTVWLEIQHGRFGSDASLRYTPREHLDTHAPQDDRCGVLL